MLYDILSKLTNKNLPILDINQYVGRTGYIDFIKADDMEYPLMRGVDCLRRPFLAIKVDCKH